MADAEDRSSFAETVDDSPPDGAEPEQSTPAAAEEDAEEQPPSPKAEESPRDGDENGPTGEGDEEVKPTNEGDDEGERTSETLADDREETQDDSPKEKPDEQEALDDENPEEVKRGSDASEPLGEEHQIQDRVSEVTVENTSHKRISVSFLDIDDDFSEVSAEQTEDDVIGEVEEDGKSIATPDSGRQRRDLVKRYHEALRIRQELWTRNQEAQLRLANALQKKGEEEKKEESKEFIAYDQRFSSLMADYGRHWERYEEDKHKCDVFSMHGRHVCKEHVDYANTVKKSLVERKKAVALGAVMRSGKPIPPKALDDYMVDEMEIEDVLINVRVDNINLRADVKAKQMVLKNKEQLAEGISLVDFEQLKVENQMYNEKIEENNEELYKLRKKDSGTVQVLSHMKEKIKFVREENLKKINEVKEVETSLGQSRDVLIRTKRARDEMKKDNQKLKEKCGLVGNDPLLLDFEETTDMVSELKTKQSGLETRHAELTLKTKRLKRLIARSKHTHRMSTYFA